MFNSLNATEWKCIMQTQWLCVVCVGKRFFVIIYRTNVYLCVFWVRKTHNSSTFMRNRLYAHFKYMIILSLGGWTHNTVEALFVVTFVHAVQAQQRKLISSPIYTYMFHEKWPRTLGYVYVIKLRNAHAALIPYMLLLLLLKLRRCLY